MSIFSKLFGSEKTLSRLSSMVEHINELEKDVRELSAEQLLLESNKLRDEVRSGTELDAILPRAFALVREASRRALGQRHYDVQLMGGIVIHEGDIVEMRTGEGKTLAATAPTYLNALAGKGVHVITVNDYLARRDAVWMGQVYHALGISVACLTHDSAYLYDPDFVMETEPLGVDAEGRTDARRDLTGAFKVEQKFLRPVSRREGYQADITYGTNHEFGFDYLRDNMAYDKAVQVQRGQNFAIIDEVDSILIDEARTPLIIAAPDAQSSELYKTFAGVARKLIENDDYAVDRKFKTVSINDSGIEKVEKMLSINNIYDPENFRLVHFLEEALRANALFSRDKDYVVKNGEVIIVDPFTGRMLMGRRYSGGLHQSIEAKEGVQVKEESKTVASITIQNYFRMYSKLAGMTGTAETSAEEFHSVYGLDVVTIPTNKPSQRKDMPDLVYRTQAGKYSALVQEVKKRNAAGQPMLIGTVAIEKNELISNLLSEAGIAHEVLNAKNHEREGEIIAQAGRKGSVTVATNVAGRGVDIILGGNPPTPQDSEEIKNFGGLHVIGTERHEARRIDNQLRGRAGRQGDPGSSQFFVSLEDELMKIFGGERIQNMMQSLGVPEDVPIESGIVSKAIEQAQSKVEGFNFDARKHTLEYDDVINKQRQAVYGYRKRVLEADSVDEVYSLAKEAVFNNLARLATAPLEEIPVQLAHAAVISKPEEFNFEGHPDDTERIKFHLEELCEAKLKNVIKDENAKGIRFPMLQIIDQLWMSHLENIDALRDSVRLRAYAQHDPLIEFKREGYRLYKDLFAHYETMFFSSVFRLDPAALARSTTVRQQQNQKEIHASGTAKANQVSGSGRKVGRNDPCPCGSGKKYKKCHGA